MIAKGTFEIAMSAEPPYDTEAGVTLSRVRFEKRFSGPLEAQSVVQMLGARTAIESSAGYVALEQVRGALDGRKGSFVLQHSGVMNRGARTLSVTVVPDSGTGALAGLAGSMQIEIVEGKHHYVFDYTLESGADAK